jgi:hypothetical protein
MTLLRELKKKVNSVFDFYLQFQRKKFWALLGTVLLIGVGVSICVLICSYMLTSITRPGSSFSYEQLLDPTIWLMFRGRTVIFITLFTFSLAPGYFYDIRRTGETPLFFNRLRGVPSKKIGHYFFFILIIALLDLVPEPMRYYDMFAYYSDYEPSNFYTFLYLWFELLTYLLGLLFCYILINKESIDFNVILKERVMIAVALLTFFLLWFIENHVYSFFENYLGILVTPQMPITIFLTLIIALFKIVISTLIIPGQIIALSNDEEALNKVSKQNIRSESDDILDEFDDEMI